MKENPLVTKRIQDIVDDLIETGLKEDKLAKNLEKIDRIKLATEHSIKAIRLREVASLLKLPPSDLSNT